MSTHGKYRSTHPIKPSHSVPRRLHKRNPTHKVEKKKPLPNGVTASLLPEGHIIRDRQEVQKWVTDVFSGQITPVLPVVYGRDWLQGKQDTVYLQLVSMYRAFLSQTDRHPTYGRFIYLLRETLGDRLISVRTVQTKDIGKWSIKRGTGRYYEVAVPTKHLTADATCGRVVSLQRIASLPNQEDQEDE